MNCEKFRENLHGFLEDNLPEAVWKEAALHAEECGGCRGLSLSQNSAASDLKRLSALAVPEEFRSYFRPALRPPAPAAAPRIKIDAARLFKSAAAVLFLILALKAVFTVVPWIAGRIRSVFENPQVLQDAEPAALRELKTIARRLGVGDAGETAPSSDAPALKESIGKGIYMKPLHLHFAFADEPAKRDFVSFISEMHPDFSYQSPSFWVLSLTHAQLMAVLNAAKSSRYIKLEDTFLMDRDSLPEFQGTIRVSFYLDVPSEEEPLALSQHWHFSFMLPNRYNLLEKLQEMPVKLIYQAPELWIFEVPGSKMDGFVKAVKDYPGVKADFGKKKSEQPDSDDVVERVFIYLKE